MQAEFGPAHQSVEDAATATVSFATQIAPEHTPLRDEYFTTDKGYSAHVYSFAYTGFRYMLFDDVLPYEGVSNVLKFRGGASIGTSKGDNTMVLSPLLVPMLAPPLNFKTLLTPSYGKTSSKSM